MRNKTRFQYVDELRKINTIEKVGIIESFYPEDFEEHKQDKTKFIRYKEHISNEQIQPYKEANLFHNPIISSYKKDIEAECSNTITMTSQNLSHDIDYYHNWSQSLNHEIKQRDYKHRFYFKHAQPPPRNKEQSNKEKKKEEESNRVPGVQKQGEITDQGDTNIDLPHKGKYNFQQITKHIYGQRHTEEKEGTYHRDMTIKNEIAEYRKLKNLRDIEKIGTFAQEFNKFNYYIEPHRQDYHIQFVDNSVVITNNNIKIDYFRDIGQPARNIMNYTIKNNSKMRRQEDDSVEVENMYDQQKREILYLYFLKEDQLKINKLGISFSDLVNISMGRITPTNAHMCIRSEKVTKAQYMKLLKKMQKYDMRENESGKPKADKEVCTDQMDDLLNVNNNNANKEQDDQSEQGILSIEKIIEEINQIKKQVKKIEQSKSSVYNESNFNREAYSKLDKLAHQLYDQIMDKSHKKYHLDELAPHIHEFQGQQEKGYDKVRLLWFIANIYQDFHSKNRKKPDLRDMVNLRPKGIPVNTNYKGKKVIGQETIQTKKVYGFNQKQANRSKSPIATTPLKNAKNKGRDSTPVKSTLTEKKKNRISTTPIKTAKK